jgi:predicted phosphodiesterase
MDDRPHSEMRLAVVADVHGSLVGLQAVLEDLDRVRPELVVHGGDLALGGSHPAECVDAIRERGWPGVMGNADEVLVTGRMELDRRPWVAPALVAALRRSQDWAVERLGPERVRWLAALPRVWRLGDRVAIVHAVPDDLWTNVRPDAGDGELRSTYGPLGASIVVYGHIHQPYVRALEGLTVANAGAVGGSYDGDPRASYVLVENGVCTVRRVSYDVERAVAEIDRAEHPMAAQLAETMRTGRPPTAPGA